MFRRAYALLSVAVVGVFALVAGPGEARTLDEILKSGEIRVGVNPTLPPRALYNEKNEIAGFEPEIAEEIAKKLGVKLVLVVVGSPDRIPFVATGKVDFVMGAMSRTAERGKVIDFTVPVHSENFGVVTRKDTGITTWQQLNDEKITLVQVRGTVSIPIIQAKMPKAKMLLLDNYQDRDRALAQKRADASVDGLDSLSYRLPRTFKDVDWAWFGTPDLVEPHYSSLGVAKGNTTLRDWLNLALYELHEAHFIEEKWKEWFGSPMTSKVPLSPWF